MRTDWETLEAPPEPPGDEDAPGPAAGRDAGPDPQAAWSLAGALAVVGLTAVVVGVATASDGVAGVAYVVAGACLAAAALLAVTGLLLRPVPLPASALPPAPAGALARMDADDLALYAGELGRYQDALADRARHSANRASAITALGAVLLVLALPVFWLAGDPELLPGGRWGSVAMLLVAVAPVAALALSRAVLLGEWSPAEVLPPAPGEGGDGWRLAALRTLAARRLAAIGVTEVVVARRRRITTMMVWILSAEVLWLLAVAIVRIGRT